MINKSEKSVEMEQDQKRERPRYCYQQRKVVTVLCWRHLQNMGRKSEKNLTTNFKV